MVEVRPGMPVILPGEGSLALGLPRLLWVGVGAGGTHTLVLSTRWPQPAWQVTGAAKQERKMKPLVQPVPSHQVEHFKVVSLNLIFFAISVKTKPLS